MTTLCLCDLTGYDDELALEARLRAEHPNARALMRKDSASATQPDVWRTEAPAWTQ